MEEINKISGEYKNKIVRLNYIDDADVNLLYSNSLFFTYLSRYEGFGIPPLEAMQAGTPVITSNNSSLPEVVGDASIMIDCENEKQCIEAFETFYYNESIRKNYIKKGIEQAKLFNWEKTVGKMTEAITSIL
jgi:glycosyltransferase involved in cell wall biosynthesis